MSEPKRYSSLDLLRPDFRKAWEAWRDAIQPYFKFHTIAQHETFRDQARQDWLYNHGRVLGIGTPGRFLTMTRDSNHKYRLALDFHFRDNTTGQADWNPDLYEKAFTLLPLIDYDLQDVRPFEWNHVELYQAKDRRASPEIKPAPAAALMIYQDGRLAFQLDVPAGSTLLQRVDPENGRIHMRVDDQR